MKKAQKEQAENIIRLLYHVHDGIKKAAEQKRYEEATELLSRCQESAIDLGETIEKIEGEGCPAVAALENYCETVYQAYVLAKQGRGADASRICKSMKKALIRVENSVKKDITVRREVVFFPYKASMWDSLESVYLRRRRIRTAMPIVCRFPIITCPPDRKWGRCIMRAERFQRRLK